MEILDLLVLFYFVCISCTFTLASSAPQRAGEYLKIDRREKEENVCIVLFVPFNTVKCSAHLC